MICNTRKILPWRLCQGFRVLVRSNVPSVGEWEVFEHTPHARKSLFFIHVWDNSISHYLCWGRTHKSFTLHNQLSHASWYIHIHFVSLKTQWWFLRPFFKPLRLKMTSLKGHYVKNWLAQRDTKFKMTGGTAIMLEKYNFGTQLRHFPA
jgi:hypothetical protein